MPFKDFTIEPLTSADVDLYLMSQVIIRCTSGTRPSSPAEGWHIYETDTQRFMVYKSGVWVLEGADIQVVRKTADESVTSSTTVQQDDHLSLPFLANSVYIFEFRLVADGAAGIKFEIWSNNGTKSHITLFGTDPGTGNPKIGSFQWTATATSGAGSSGGFSESLDDMLVIGQLITSGAAGTVRVAWAQNTSSGSAITVRAGSWMRLTRIP